MHEVRLTAALLRETVRLGNGLPVSRVEARIGALYHPHPPTLAFAWRVVARDTPAEGAELEVEIAPGDEIEVVGVTLADGGVASAGEQQRSGPAA